MGMMDWSFHWPMMSGWIAIGIALLFSGLLFFIAFKTNKKVTGAFDQNSVVIIFVLAVAVFWAFGMHIIWTIVAALILFYLYWTFIHPRL